MKPDATVFELQADLCLALGHATRLRMIHLLEGGPRCVGEIAVRLQLSQPTASRHLTVLRNAGILDVHRHGTDAVYRIATPQVVETCNLIRAILTKRVNDRSEILRERSAGELETDRCAS